MSTKIIPKFRPKPKRRPAHNKKTAEQYKAELSEKNPNLEIVGAYIDARTPTYHFCRAHNYYWKISPDNALRGQGCKYCKADKTRQRDIWSNEFYLKKLNDINPCIVPLEEYVDSHFPIWHWFLDCGHMNKSSPTSLLRKGACLRCTDLKRGFDLRKTHDEYIKELSEINPYIEVLSTYNVSMEKIFCRCKICDYKWNVSPHSLLGGSSCPLCAFSIGEKEIRKFLDNNQISFIPQYSIKGLVGLAGGLLSYDFYLPNNNLLIEFQGKQHERPIAGYFGGEKQFKIQQEHDRRKREYANAHGIKLLEIWYYEEVQIERILRENLNIESVETVREA